MIMIVTIVLTATFDSEYMESKQYNVFAGIVYAHIDILNLTLCTDAMRSNQVERS